MVSEAVSEAIVERGDDDTVSLLLANDGARMSRETHEMVVDRAVENPALHAAVAAERVLKTRTAHNHESRRTDDSLTLRFCLE